MGIVATRGGEALFPGRGLACALRGQDEASTPGWEMSDRHESGGIYHVRGGSDFEMKQPEQGSIRYDRSDDAFDREASREIAGQIKQVAFVA